MSEENNASARQQELEKLKQEIIKERNELIAEREAFSREMQRLKQEVVKENELAREERQKIQEEERKKQQEERRQEAEKRREEAATLARKSTITGQSGDVFHVEAMAAPAGQTFKSWKVSNGDATIGDPSGEQTVVTLKSENSLVQATYSVNAFETDEKLRLRVTSGYVETEKEKKQREKLEKEKSEENTQET